MPGMATPIEPQMRGQGQHLGPPMDLPIGVTRATIRVPRTQRPEGQGKDKDVIRIVAEISLDGGATWDKHPGFEMTSAGGDIFNMRGDQFLDDVLRFKLREPENANRQLRVMLDLYIPLHVGAHVEVE
jgi:hypothetical protein